MRRQIELRGPMGLMGLRLRGLMRLMGLIGLMVLVACGGGGGDDTAVVTPPPTPDPPTPTTPTTTEVAINFSGSESQEDAVTRAAGKPLSELGVSQFTVWGYKNMSYAEGVYGGLQTVFPGYQVDWQSGSAATTLTNSTGWEYVKADPEQTIKYWDFSAKAYRYFAVTGGLTGTDGTYGGDGTYWTTGAYKAYKIELSADATNTASANYFSRLWFSDGSTDPSSPYYDKRFGRPVTLEFVKPFTRVRFLFKYAYPREGIKLSAISFKPTNGDKIARKGTVTVHYPEDGTETKEWYTMAKDGEDAKELDEFTEDYDPENDAKTYTASDKGWYVVLPTNTQGSYTMSVTVNGEARTAVVPEQYMTWLPGYSYTYIFKITNEGGVEIGWVEYAVTPWTNLEAEHTVYNW